MPKIKMDLSKASHQIKMNLAKEGIEETNIPLMAVFEAIDCSGSMDDLYSQHWVDELLIVAGGAALTFDDNKSLQVSFFNHELYTNVPEIDETTNIESYIKDCGITASGGTYFSPVLHWFNNEDPSGYEDSQYNIEQVKSRNMFKRLFGLKDKVVVKQSSENTPELPEDLPKFLILITDGQMADFNRTLKELNQMDKDSFLFVIGLGQFFAQGDIAKITNPLVNASYVWLRNPTEYDTEKMLNILTQDQKFVEFIRKHKKEG